MSSAMIRTMLGGRVSAAWRMLPAMSKEQKTPTNRTKGTPLLRMVHLAADRFVAGLPAILCDASPGAIRIPHPVRHKRNRSTEVGPEGLEPPPFRLKGGYAAVTPQPRGENPIRSAKFEFG